MPRDVAPTIRSTSAVSTAQEIAVLWARDVHDQLTSAFARLDGTGSFREDAWERDGGGGGLSRVMVGGGLFEKAGVNRSVVSGPLPDAAAERLGGRTISGRAHTFFAGGVSVVLHPLSPMVPTLHLNVRYFEISDAITGQCVDRWFGGGTDLTPYYPCPADARDFHRALKQMCDGFDATLYAPFKAWCDRYFVNTHRGGEPRGIGGIFYDHIRPGEDGVGTVEWFAFGRQLASTAASIYAEIVARHRYAAYGERERHFQLLRRGRYVEFNLVHDRGTLFGLQTGARIESVLMSLPAIAAWDYSPVFAPGSFEAQFMDLLTPRDWASE
jgi:coproporphyrinogen III oxidase